MLSLDVSIPGISLRRGGGLSAPSLPETGLIANWLFAEGSGTTVADEVGSYPIDLTLAPSAANTWEVHGVSADNSAIQTPSITNVRTIAMLYRVNAGTGGFHQTGPTGTNKGILGSASTGAQVLHSASVKVAKGSGIGEIWFRPDTFVGSWSLNTGGWQLVFRELDADATGYLTFGGRGGVTSLRNSQFDMAWGGVYDRVLTESDRAQVFTYARSVLRARGGGNYVHFADCPTQVDAVILAGQSNADGVGLLTDLSAADQARTYGNVKIMQNVFSNATKAFSALALGSNHNENSAYFGLEVILGNLREDNPTGKDLYILKTADGGTFLAPSTDPNVAAGVTWSTDEIATSAGFWNSFLRNIYYATTDALENGIGLNYRTAIWWQGESDALYASTADVYGAQIIALVDSFGAHTGLSSLPWVVMQTKHTPPPNASGETTVRAAQAAQAAAMGGRATLIDAAAYDVSGDGLHVSAAGLAVLGGDIYATLS